MGAFEIYIEKKSKQAQKKASERKEEEKGERWREGEGRGIDIDGKREKSFKEGRRE